MMRLSLVAMVVVTIVFLGASSAQALGPEPMKLWPEGAPGAVGMEDADQPSIRVYRPEKPNGTAVVICPGGGYGGLAFDHEGHQIAKWFETFGVTGVVLKYRLGPRYRHPAPLQDVSRAIRMTRQNAGEWGLSDKRIGVMGFSAGGYLASTVSTHFDNGQADSTDPIETHRSRPDFSILCYPVISFVADFTHKGSINNLLGKDPERSLLENLSNETQVTPQTPPTFLFHTAEDKGVPAQNSIAYFQACLKQNVPAELHIYQNGPHGVGLAFGDPVLFTWKDRLQGWMQTNGLLVDAQRAAVKGKVTVKGQPLKWGTITFIPTANEQLPVASALVGGGNYSIPENRGAVVGTCQVTIRTMGTFEPQPTEENATVLDQGNLRVEVTTGENNFELDLQD